MDLSFPQSRSLLGYLNHACSVVRPGRSFIGRLISLLTDAKRKHRDIIRINTEARSDIKWWTMFIESWNGVSILRDQILTQPDHELWSDASGSWGQLLSGLPNGCSSSGHQPFNHIKLLSKS